MDPILKQQANKHHPPMTVDPSGSGATASASLIGEAGMGGGAHSFDDGPAVAAGSRKRGRDIRGLDRFRNVVYGEDGFRRLHAMVARNPILMYPPEGIEEARARVSMRKAARENQLPSAPERHAHHRHPLDDGDDDVFGLFAARRRAESAARPAAEAEGESGQCASEQTPPLSSLAAIRRDDELATYHHRQLDSFLRLLYEFNHIAFVKLPMEDTLQLLSRCGKESVAHVIEYEAQVRLRRQSRIRELSDLQRENAALEERRLAVEDAEHTRLVESAEQRQAELSLELDEAVAKAETPGRGCPDDDAKMMGETDASYVHLATLLADSGPDE
ncbi:hypothetical protein GH5_07828 [Leishmania sp. Ghana 2012 LV757]|uniref:hypothetical protein n=1 Tax=Leishmania sp. Ghana 2012 LV757 TaxID=2803181 RepID=UPI001B7C0F2B|nr:hypothetical protein GH5_07828 [Leishmania sp. Ghana 2012 LV757]